jgi:predicted glycogen debranching enzyme
VRTSFGKTDCQDLKTALSKEWLETNGLGGFASSTIIGANTRRQHGLLIAALTPPVARHLLLSKMEERADDAYLCTNLYPGTVYPHGFNIQTEFQLRPWPTFRYATSEFEIEKTVTLIHGENTVVLAYRNVRSRAPVALRLRPLLAFRDYNALTQRNDVANLAVERNDKALSVQPYPGLPRLYFHCQPETVETRADWYSRFTYPVEQERGLDYEEDLVSPFEMTFRLPAGQTVCLVVSTASKRPKAEVLLALERERRSRFVREPDPVRRALLVSDYSFF